MTARPGAKLVATLGAAVLRYRDQKSYAAHGTEAGLLLAQGMVTNALPSIVDEARQPLMAALEQMEREHDHHYIPGTAACYGCTVVGTVRRELAGDPAPPHRELHATLRRALAANTSEAYVLRQAPDEADAHITDRLVRAFMDAGWQPPAGWRQ